MPVNILWAIAEPYLTSPLTWIFFVFGLTIGSFLNVCIFRIPEGTFWKSRRSVCRHCGAMVPGYLNIPIISWMILRGKTACCKNRLSLQYPAVEAFTGLIFVIMYWKFPFIVQMNPDLQLDAANLLRFGHGIIFLSLLIICSVIDIHHMIIPDVISLPMIALTPVVVILSPDLGWLDAIIGVVAGGAILYAIAWVYWLVRHEIGMGMGDVKLLAAIGGWLGYQSIVPTVFYGSILGAVFGVGAILMTRKLTIKSAIPFGPFLAVGAVIHMLFGGFIQEHFLGM